MPAYNAFLLTCMLFLFNIITLVIVICYIFDIKFKLNNNTTIYLALLLTGLITIINYFTLYLKRELICKRFSAIPKEKKDKRKLFWKIYEILSYVVLFLSGIYLT